MDSKDTDAYDDARQPSVGTIVLLRISLSLSYNKLLLPHAKMEQVVYSLRGWQRPWREGRVINGKRGQHDIAGR